MIKKFCCSLYMTEEYKREQFYKTRSMPYHRQLQMIAET